jgi:hypothetical protein
MLDCRGCAQCRRPDAGGRRQRSGNRDKRFDVSTAGQRRKRADIPERPLVHGGNAWRSATSVQLTLAEVPVKNLRR